MSERHETFPNIFEALVLVVALILIEVLVAALLGSAHLFADLDPQDVSLIVTVAGNGVLFIGLMAYKAIGYGTLFHPTRTSALAMLSVLALPIALIVPGLVVMAGALNSIVIWLVPMSAREIEFLQTMMSASVVSTLFGCVAAPVLEEMLFRGVILRSFLRQHSRTAAILWSSAIFAIAHLNVYQAATALAIGIVCGWLYERCRSLWPCILLHALYNSLVTVLFNLDSSDAASIDTAGYTAIAFGAAIVGGLWLVRLLSGPAVATSRQKAP
jgi:membrane protease YdiL (CAAX protease family)